MEMLQAMFELWVGPEERAVEHVDEAVAVRADHRHVAGGLDELGLKIMAVGEFGDGLGEARGVADRAAGALVAQLAHDLDGEVSVHADEGGVGGGGEVGDGAVGLVAVDLVLGGMDRPDLAGIAHLLALLDDAAGFLVAEDRDGFRADQTGEGIGGKGFHEILVVILREDLPLTNFGQELTAFVRPSYPLPQGER
jgi:hypothetical protein